MGTTLLERANPLDQLRPTTLASGRARQTLAELDQEVTSLFDTFDTQPMPARERRTKRPEPRAANYPATWNLRPRRRFIPRITVLRVSRPGPASPIEMPRSLTWLPVLRGAINAQADAGWHAWLQTWDRLMHTQRRLTDTTFAMLRQACVVNRMKHTVKTQRTVEYYTQAAWGDYLNIFGPIDGVSNTCSHVLGKLDQLGALAQT